MTRQSKYQLTASDLTLLEQVIRKDERAEVRQRATALRMLHFGSTPKEVAEVMAVGLATVYNWQRRWRQDGLAGLANRPKSGRPSVADEAYCQVLEETLNKEPPELGYAFNVWTVDRLRTHLEKETGKGLSARRFRALLKRQGYRYRRPKHDLGHLQDAEAKAKTAELLEELKKGSGKTILSSSLWTKPR